MAKGYENLIPQNMRTKDEQRNIARKGGVASGLARKKKRTLRDIFQALRNEEMEMKMPDGTKQNVPLDIASAMAMFRKATQGDTKAMKLIAELLGEYEQNVNVTSEAHIIVQSAEEAAKLRKIEKLG